MKIYRFLALFFCMIIAGFAMYAKEVPVNVTDTISITKIGGASIGVFVDATNRASFDDVRSGAKFETNTSDVLNLGVSPNTFWLKFQVCNKTGNDNLVIDLGEPTIDELSFYSPLPDGTFKITQMGEYQIFDKRIYKHPNYLFDVNIPQNQTQTFYFKIKSGEQIMVPLSVGTNKAVFSALTTKDLIFGIYFGIIIVMFLYNLFIYFSVRDNSYLYYVVYIILVGLTQTSLHGYTFKYLWPNSPWLAIESVYLLTSLAGMGGIVFLRNFLQTKKYLPGYDKGLNVFFVLFIVSIGLALSGQYNLSFTLMQLDTMILALYLLFIGYKVLRKGYRPAMFFLIAWSIFLVGVTVFILKDFGVFAYNNFTFYTMPAGSAIETILLSFALADKINTFRKEKEASQAEALLALQENERIIREQNIILEVKVTERTLELKESNNELNKALTDLKDAESQLVESEKMASLGQLTAGIAHEINNPINFVTSNVKPLKRDVDILLQTINAIQDIGLSDVSKAEKNKQIEDYKEEIDYDYLKIEISHLLKGIDEGAARTAEIVKGLRIFSRLDEDDLKRANINEGLDSTLIITNNLLNNRISIEKHYGNLPLVECYPGKLNQVFLNIISNGIYAINKKFGDKEGGILKISTSNDEKNVYIQIEDNGIGMDANTKKKLFEPFFTTKDVGEGTGLGLSIAYNTISKHNGQIIVNSTVGLGTEFIIEIPILH